MKKAFLSLACALSLSCVASAQTATPYMLFEKVGRKLLERDPSIVEFEICIERNCETFYQSDLPRKAGSGPAAVADPSQAGTVADAVSDIVGAAAKSVGIGGRVVVSYERKEADGALTKVRVEASFGTGTGAAAGASSSNPDNPDSK